MMLGREKTVVSANSTDVFGMNVAALNLEHITRLTNDFEFRTSSASHSNYAQKNLFQTQDIPFPKSRFNHKIREFQYLYEE